MSGKDLKEKAKQNGEDWGTDISSTERVRLKALIQQASIRSTDPVTNTNYILDRMGSGYWSINLGHPKQHDFGFYACIVGEYWGLVWDAGAYGWDYVLLRYN